MEGSHNSIIDRKFVCISTCRSTYIYFIRITFLLYLYFFIEYNFEIHVWSVMSHLCLFTVQFTVKFRFSQLLETIDKSIQCLSGITELNCEASWMSFGVRIIANDRASSSQVHHVTSQHEKCWNQVELNVTWDQIRAAIHTCLLDNTE